MSNDKIASAAAINATIESMAETAMNWDVETFASRTVSLLIDAEGNLNKYQRTLELVFRVHEIVVSSRQAPGSAEATG